MLIAHFIWQQLQHSCYRNMEAPELGGAERGTAHGGASETMMLVRGMHLPVYLYRCIGVSVYRCICILLLLFLSVILGSCSLVACQCAVRSAGSLYGGVRRVGLTRDTFTFFRGATAGKNY